MSTDQLEDSARKFDERVDLALVGLTDDQKEQFINGLFLALNSYFTLAHFGVLSPFEKERFMASARTNVFNRALELGVQAEDELLKEMDAGSVGMAAHYTFGARIQEQLVGPLSEEDKHTLAITLKHYHYRHGRYAQPANRRLF